MSEDTNTQTGSEPQAADQDGLNTTSNEWEMTAAMLERDPDNRDTHVQVTEPIFDGQTCVATFLKSEKGTVADGKGISVRLRLRIEQEIESKEGVKKTAGYIFSPRPSVLLPATREPGAIAAAERGLRDVGNAMIAAQLMRRGEEPMLPEFMRLIGGLEGKAVTLKLDARQGSKRGEDGNFPMFQNVRYAAAGGDGAADPWESKC